MKKTVLLFDLDGTLLDTVPDLATAVNYALSTLGYPKRSEREIADFIGNGVSTLLARAVPVNTPPQKTAEALSLFREYYASHISLHTRPYDGITEALRALRACGYTMAVISNKFDGGAKALISSFFEDCFSVVLGDPEDGKTPKKPAPDLVFRAMEVLRAAREDCVYIGDSEVDLQTANAAGIPCLGCAWGSRGRTFLEVAGLSPQRIFDTPRALLAFILEEELL